MGPGFESLIVYEKKKWRFLNLHFLVRDQGFEPWTH